MKREARGATRGEALGLRHEGEGLGVRGLLEEGRGVVVIVARGRMVVTVKGKGAWL